MATCGCSIVDKCGQSLSSMKRMKRTFYEWDAELQNLTIVNHHNKNSSKHLQVLCTRLAALKIIKPPKNPPISQSSDLSFAPDCKVACRSSGVWTASWLCQLELAKWWKTMAKPWCFTMAKHAEIMLKHGVSPWWNHEFPPAEFAIRATGQFQHVLWGLPHLSFSPAASASYVNVSMGPMCQWDPRKLHFSGSSKIVLWQFDGSNGENDGHWIGKYMEILGIYKD